MTWKGWRAAVSYSQEGGGRAWRKETGAEVKKKQRWTVRKPKAKGQLRKPERFLPPQGADRRAAALQPSSSAIFSQFCDSRPGRDATCCLSHEHLPLSSCLLSLQNNSWCHRCSLGILLVAGEHTGGESWVGI